MATAVIVGTTGNAASSPDAVTWTPRTVTYASAFTAACRTNNSQFLAAGDHNILDVSVDGTTWTQHNPSGLSTSANLTTASDNGTVWAVGNSSGQIATSPDGLSWTAQTSPFAGAINGSAWSPALGLFVMVGDGARTSTSPDGVTWTAVVTIAAMSQAFWVTWSPSLGLFLMGGSDTGGPAQNLVYTSPDGTTWTSHISGFGTGAGTGGLNHTRGGAWSEPLRLFAMGGDSGRIRTSPDGSTWTEQTNGFGGTQINKLRWLDGLGLFAACGNAGKLGTSPDGVTWTQQTTGFGADAVRDVACTFATHWTVGSIRN